jgi:hypothetical protein
MRNAGSAMSRIWGGIKGAVSSIQHVNHVGPKALNGGEVIISAGKLIVFKEREKELTCEIHRWRMRVHLSHAEHGGSY